MKQINPHIKKRFRMGSLYNAFAAQSVAFPPDGWHLPSKAEYETLIDRIKLNYGYSQETVIRILKSKWFWDEYVEGEHDRIGFTALPAGRRVSFGNFYGLNSVLMFVTSDGGFSPGGDPYATYFMIDSKEFYYFFSFGPTHGGSVRLIKNDDDLPTGNIVYDVNGNGYRCVKYGSQVWTAENWKCTRMSSFGGDSIPIVTNSNEWVNLTTPARCYYDNNPLYV